MAVLFFQRLVILFPQRPDPNKRIAAEEGSDLAKIKFEDKSE